MIQLLLQSRKILAFFPDPQSEHWVLVTRIASGIPIVKPEKLEGTSRVTFSTHGVINFLPSQQFYIFVATFSGKAMLQIKHMVIAYATDPLTVVMAALCTSLHHFPMRTFESLNPAIFSSVHPVPYKEPKLTAYGKAESENDKTTNSQYILVATVYNKSAISQASEIREHTHI